jgi:hypothetical protein
MSTLAETICREARRWNLRLELRGDKIAVIPGSKAPPQFIELVRENKAALLSWLEATGAGLPRDQAPWLHVAKQVLAGEFDGADGRTRESLTIGLRTINHPTCRQALARLQSDKDLKP